MKEKIINAYDLADKYIDSLASATPEMIPYIKTAFLQGANAVASIHIHPNEHLPEDYKFLLKNENETWQVLCEVENGYVLGRRIKEEEWEWDLGEYDWYDPHIYWWRPIDMF